MGWQRPGDAGGERQDVRLKVTIDVMIDMEHETTSCVALDLGELSLPDLLDINEP
jgi:hypothetical protein